MIRRELLPFVERSSGGIRLFKDSDFEWLSMIECMKQTGMPKTFIDLCMAGDSTISERLNLIRRQQEVVHAQMAQLQSTLDMLDYKEWYYLTAQQAGYQIVCQKLDKFAERGFSAAKNRAILCLLSKMPETALEKGSVTHG